MQVVEYYKELEKEWDAFVMKSKNGNLMHTQKFLSYHDEGKWNDKSILLYVDDKIIAVFPACLVGDKIISHAGATYGGLIVKRENKFEESLEMIDCILDHYKKHKEIIYKNQEYIFDKYPSDEVHFAAVRKGFVAKHFELTTAIDLADYSISKNRGDKINRGNKKVEIKINDDNYDLFYKLLVNNLSDKHNVSPTHSYEEMLKLKALFPDKFILFGAYTEGKLIGGVWLVKLTNDVFHSFYVAQDYDYKQLYTSSVMIEGIINYAKMHNCKYMNLGVSTEEKGDVFNLGLYNFKETFGGFGVNRITYSKVL